MKTMASITKAVLISRSQMETESWGQWIGRRLANGAVLRLEGELGCGKTCFVRGLARGLGISPDYDIVSPTYTLVNVYQGRVQLVHADLYRLAEPVDAESLELLDWLGGDAVVAVEWAEKLHPRDWPAESLVLRFEVGADGLRRITLIGYGLGFQDLVKVAAHKAENHLSEAG